MAIADEKSQRRHRDFPLLYDRSGLLRCMMHQAPERTLFFRLSTLQPLRPGRVNRALDIQPWQVLERYGFDEAERQPAFANLDPVTFAERIVFTSKKMLRKDRTHARIVWLRDSRGEWRQMAVIAENRAEKHLVMHQFADLVREIGCDAFMEVGEMWTGEAEKFWTQHSPDLEKYTGRGEALVVQLATRDGLERSYSTPFSRGKDGGIKLGETDQVDLVRTYHLTPIRLVWADQRRSSEGSRVKVAVWEPDALELCPCGGDQPFGVCCKPELASADLGNIEIRALLQSGQIAEAEKIARARVARYAIWIRQHTALSINADRDFAQHLIPVDAHALEHELNQLEDCILAGGNTDLMLFTYRRLQEILGVPALARRMVSLAARWLIRTGSLEEGLLELDGLGEITRCRDWLALTLAAQHGGYTDEHQTVLLEKAVEAALESIERSLALRTLAYHHLFSSRPRASLDAISALMSDPKADEQILHSVKALRWHISNKRDDLDDALIGMHHAQSPADRIRYMSWLMDRNHISEALELASPLLEEKNKTAMLLATECYLRQSNPVSASELFDKIDVAELSTQEFVLGHAHVQALLVLDGNREDLRPRALRDLEFLREGNAETMPAIVSLLGALRGQGPR
jgi:hypothetical protein